MIPARLHASPVPTPAQHRDLDAALDGALERHRESIGGQLATARAKGFSDLVIILDTAGDTASVAPRAAALRWLPADVRAEVSRAPEAGYAWAVLVADVGFHVAEVLLEDLLDGQGPGADA
jgi:hypothetical protein